MRNTYNFSAGPAVLPEEVLREAAAEMLDWHGSGTSVMEMSHRGSAYMGIHAQAEADLRELMGIPASHRVLFLQGGASLQFAMVPMNLLRGHDTIDFVNTGQWSSKAIGQAGAFARAHVAASSADRNFSYVPAREDWRLTPQAAYLHLCLNETIGGVEIFDTPDVGTVPLVADISSTFLSRPIDVSRYALLYGGAQKNIGPAGLTIVIVREDMLGHAPPGTPPILDYKAMADADSMLNTPPTFAIYVAGLVFQWLKRQGGVAAIEQRNIAKARLLYDAIDASGLYANPVALRDRSRMNVPFTLARPELDERFLAGARSNRLLELKGHRTVGGMRASIYNAMPLAGVQALVDYMREFERTQG